MTFRISLSKFKDTTFVAFVFATIIVDIFRILNAVVLPLGDSATVLFRNLVYICLFGCSLIISLNSDRSGKIFLFTSAIYVIAVLISLVVNPKISVLLSNNVLMIFSRIIPACVIASSLDNFDQAVGRILRWKWILLLYLIVFLLWGMKGERYYYMNVGYNLLYPTLVILFNKKKKIVDSFIALSSILVIVLFCARGTALILIISAGLFYVVNMMKENNSKKKILFSLFLIVVVVIFIMAIPLIISKLYTLFPSSRTLYYLISGQIMDSSGRDNYYAVGIKEFCEHPFRLRGILGDRVFYGEVFNLSDFEGAFAHNVILEVLLQFGMIIGLPICVWFIKTIIVTFKNVLKSNSHTTLIMLHAIILPSLIICMSTASYLASIETSLMLGTCIALNKQLWRT